MMVKQRLVGEPCGPQTGSVGSFSVDPPLLRRSSGLMSPSFSRSGAEAGQCSLEGLVAALSSPERPLTSRLDAGAIVHISGIRPEAVGVTSLAEVISGSMTRDTP